VKSVVCLFLVLIINPVLVLAWVFGFWWSGIYEAFMEGFAQGTSYWALESVHVERSEPVQAGNSQEAKRK
jgi:hypothetical protein